MVNTLVFVEHRDGEFKKATLSAVTFARQVADKTGAAYDMVVVGEGLSNVTAEAAKYGAAKVYVVDAPALKDYTDMTWAAAVAAVAKQSGASVVAGAATTAGKGLLPRVAALLDAGMASDIVGFGDKGASLSFLRPMWAGNVIGEVEITSAVQVASVRGTDFDAAEPTGDASPVEAVTVTLGNPTQRLVSFKATVSSRPEMTEASVVIAGGRGVKSKENFKLIEDLADVLGGAIGASRAAVDAEFVENDYQIGQTGKVIAPDLYIGAGISGAIQHLAGMKNSKVIVAINKDEEAPIFDVADYGLVADLFKVLPELTEKLKARKG